MSISLKKMLSMQAGAEPGILFRGAKEEKTLNKIVTFSNKICNNQIIEVVLDVLLLSWNHQLLFQYWISLQSLLQYIQLNNP